MADNTQTAQGTGQSTGDGKKVAGDGIVIDKNKSQEKYIEEVEDKYIVPGIIREKFPDLVKLIYETESMNEEEREYWLQIMPIMTEVQIKKFRDILVNEKKQLAKLDNEYKNSIKAPVKDINEEELKAKLATIKNEEKSSELEESKREEDVLKELENL